MSELRQDRTTGAWTIIAPERGLRPHHVSATELARERVPRFEPTCPFCPGNESQLPGMIAETHCNEPPGWRTRIVPNKFPALTLDAPAPHPIPGLHMIRAYGAHEVVIENPRHDTDLTAMDDGEITAVVECYYQRFTELARRPGIETVVLFRNHGARSGASLRHPHAQLIALGLAIPKLRLMAEWGCQHYRETSRCPTCEELELETKLGERVVDETRDFLAFVPFAAERSFEVLLVPKRHQASFAEIAEDEVKDLAIQLRQSLQRLKAVHDDPPHNLIIESAGKSGLGAPHLHWRLRIVPGLVRWGAFEVGTGMAINPSRPEQDAEALRATLRNRVNQNPS
jgi:UDPglucose--hexose-1-phosphate uridylyltransferase